MPGQLLKILIFIYAELFFYIDENYDFSMMLKFSESSTLNVEVLYNFL